MRRFTKLMVLGLAILLTQVSIQAQLTTGSISGTVTDSTGAVVPGASVSVKGEGGQSYTATTNSEGVFTIPGVAAGTPRYTVTITAPNFKTSVVNNVKVDVATPTTVNAVMEAGSISETVVITGGGEVLQTETATVGSTLNGRQILETPIQSRDALDLVTLLPGTATVGNARTSSINGLPKSAITIQIDGVDVQDNYLKSSDGFFTFIRPRLDAIDEVTVSTATPGSESAGDGAIGIKFQTRRGTDNYHGSLFEQHRDEGLNTNNFVNNYLGLSKQKLRLNQFGGSIGGPIPFLGLGEGVPLWNSGKGKRYFFVNYERYHINEQSPTRARTVLTTEAQSGVFRYLGTFPNATALPTGCTLATAGATTYTANCTRDVLALAGAYTGDCNFGQAGTQPCTTTTDPTVIALLNRIRGTTSGTGTFQPLGTGNVFYGQTFNFQNPGQQRRRFLAIRTDFNITKNHAFETIWNDQPFRSNVDFLNSVDPAFPGLANAGTQQSDRRSLSMGLRSNFGSKWVNQFRYAQLGGWLGGNSRFDLVGGTEWFDSLGFGGLNPSLGVGSNPTIRNAYSARESPTKDFTDNVTTVRGNHTITFGGQWKKVGTISDSVSPVRSTVGFGYVGVAAVGGGVFTGDVAVQCAITQSALTPAANGCAAGTGGITLPGATATDVAAARALYGVLTGRVSSFASTVYLEGDGQYRLNGSRHFEIEEATNGMYVQDSWKLKPNFTITGGIRWQPTVGAKLNTTNYALLSDPVAMAYDVSGFGNSFKPGTLTGQVPTFRLNKAGEKAYPNDLNNFAPSVGFVWAPESFLPSLFGKSGNSVIRGGWSRAYIREGTLTVENSLGLNPGGTFTNSRSAANGTLPAQILTVGTLLRDAGNPNLTAPAFSSTPVFPRAVNPNNDATFAFAPDFRTGYVDSWNIGYQRQIGRDTVVEARYVGNRGKDMQTQYRVNEVNAVENGFAAEFAKAQKNLLLNIAAGQGATFRYNSAVAGTVPLPIILSYFSGNFVDPNNSASYTSSFFGNSTFLASLNPASPGVQGMVNTLDFNFRANTQGVAGAGQTQFQAVKPSNFVHTCPNTFGFCYVFDNTEKSWYDAVQIEVRRRMSNGVRLQASYVWGKAFTNAFASAGDSFFGSGAGDQSNTSSNTLRNRDLDKSYAQIDIRHAFKFDATWDLPFGRGRKFLSGGGASDKVFGGWSIVPTVRWQSGSPILMENVQFVGMTAKELQDAVKVYYGQKTSGGTYVHVSYLPMDIIENTIKAFTLVTPSTTNVTGYSSAPTGKFIAPAGYNNCQASFVGECGFRKFVLYGPGLFKMDAAIIKRINFGERTNVELRVAAYDVLNHTNWRIGSFTSNVSNITSFVGTFGQLGSGNNYQDPSGSNDPGGRVLDLMFRINW